MSSSPVVPDRPSAPVDRPVVPAGARGSAEIRADLDRVEAFGAGLVVPDETRRLVADVPSLLVRAEAAEAEVERLRDEVERATDERRERWKAVAGLAEQRRASALAETERLTIENRDVWRQVDAEIDKRCAAEAELTALRRAVRTVTELHRRAGDGPEFCLPSDDDQCRECGRSYPCPTARAALAVPADQPATRRYRDCDDTCTTDCGHCKGAGRPTTCEHGKTEAHGLYHGQPPHWIGTCFGPTPDERPTHCPECAHSLDTGEHADWCMTARDPAALRRLRGAPDERPKDGEQ